MELAFTEDQDELRQLVRSFLTDKSPSMEVRRLMETEQGYDAAVWEQMARQLGLQGLVVPERYGGAGFGWVELAIVFEEMGRSLLCAPFFATTALATSAVLAAADDRANAELLPDIASGRTIATVAFTEDNGRWDDAGIRLSAAREGATWRLSGHKSYVVDGTIADLVVVAARTTAGLSLFAVDGAVPGLVRRSMPTLDQTRKLARLEFHDTAARLIGEQDGAAPVLARMRHLAAVALAAEQVGGAQRCLDMSVDYAKHRYQFGRPVGSFQAVKHRCADTLVDVEMARSVTHLACRVAADDGHGLAEAASLAKTYSSEACSRAAENNIQVHGGIGFTWEHDAHLYLKRAKSSEQFLGSPSYHRELLAQHIGV